MMASISIMLKAGINTTAFTKKKYILHTQIARPNSREPLQLFKFEGYVSFCRNDIILLSTYKNSGCKTERSECFYNSTCYRLIELQCLQVSVQSHRDLFLLIDTTPPPRVPLARIFPPHFRESLIPHSKDSSTTAEQPLTDHMNKMTCRYVCPCVWESLRFLCQTWS